MENVQLMDPQLMDPQSIQKNRIIVVDLLIPEKAVVINIF